MKIEGKIKHEHGKNPNSRNGFQKGHKMCKGSEKGWFKKGYKIPIKIIKKRTKSYLEYYDKNGRITLLNRFLRSQSKFKIWRELVFLRDNFTCQNPNCKYCNNKIGVLLHPHHIKSFIEFPELRFRVDNGITYCAEFHIKSRLHKNIHKVQKGVRNNG